MRVKEEMGLREMDEGGRGDGMRAQGNRNKVVRQMYQEIELTVASDLLTVSGTAMAHWRLGTEWDESGMTSRPGWKPWVKPLTKKLTKERFG